MSVPVARGRFPAVEVHAIESRYVRQTFRIEVMRPCEKAGETERFPVVYATDGNFVFDALKGISHSIQMSSAPRFILVGIGYPGDSPLAGALLRARDMTFPGYPKLELQPPPIEGVLSAPAGAQDFYGAADFQQFLEHELFPFIDARYATASADRAYFGHSLGGGFGLHTLFTRTHLFKRYIVSSPGIAFHGAASPGHRYEHYDFLLDDAQRFIDAKPRLPGVRLHLSVGAEEEFEPGGESWQLTSNYYRLARLLKAASIPGLALTTETFSGETHMTAWPIAFIRGIRAVYA